MRHILLSVGCWSVSEEVGALFKLRNDSLGIDLALDVYDVRDLKDVLSQFDIVQCNLEETK